MQLTEQKDKNVDIEMSEIERKQEVSKRHAEEIQALKTTKQKLVVPIPFLAME